MDCWFTGSVELPLDLPVIERDVVRLVVQDVRGHVLLFWTHEGSMPELGHWWELPGGGIDEGETCVEAAVREMREETGIQIVPEQVGAPTWRRTASFRHRQTRRLQHEAVLSRPTPRAPTRPSSREVDRRAVRAVVLTVPQRGSARETRWEVSSPPPESLGRGLRGPPDRN